MFATYALAASTSAAGNPLGGSGGLIAFGVQIGLILIAFYFLMIRPQQQRQKQQAAKLDATKKGDSVVTAGGILGKVTKVEDQHVEVEIAPNVKVRVVKATLSDVTPLGGGKPAND